MPPSSPRLLVWTTSLQDPIASLSWAGDSRAFAVMTTEGRGQVVAAVDGQRGASLAGHTGGGFGIAWHPTESCIATAGQDGRVRLWEAQSGQEAGGFDAGAAWVELLAWAPSGTWLAAGAGRRLLLWSHSQRRVVHTLTDHRSTLTALDWQIGAEVVGVTCYGTVRFYDAAKGQPLETLPWKTSLISLARSPDNRWVAAGTQEQSIQIWPLPFREGEELAMSGYPAKVRELAWHPSGKYLATGGGEQIMVWNCSGAGPAGTSPTILEGHTGRVASLGYQTQGHLLASGGLDHRLLFWNARKSATPLAEVPWPSAITTLRWSPDNSTVAVGCQDGTVGLVRAPVG